MSPQGNLIELKYRLHNISAQTRLRRGSVSRRTIVQMGHTCNASDILLAARAHRGVSDLKNTIKQTIATTFCVYTDSRHPCEISSRDAVQYTRKPADICGFGDNIKKNKNRYQRRHRAHHNFLAPNLKLFHV